MLSILKTAKEDTNKVNTLNTLSNQYIWLTDFQASKKYAVDALLLSQKINFKKGIANAYNNMANLANRQSNSFETLKYQLAALKIREEIGDKIGIGASYNNIGIFYLDQGNYPDALKYYLVSLKIREEVGDKQRIAESYNNIGEIYTNQGNYSEALKNYFAALKIFEERGAINGMSVTNQNIGHIYRQQGSYAEALKHYLVPLKIYEKTGDKPGIADSYSNIGLLYVAQGNYQEALKNCLASLKINEEMEDRERIAECYNVLGNLYIKLNKPFEAKKYLDNALSFNKEMGIREGIRDAYNSLAELDSSQSNFKSAYQNHKMYILYRDSLINKENAEKIVRLQMQYEFDKKEAATELEQQKAIEATKNRSNVVMMISAILIISSLFIILLIRQRNLKKRAVEKARASHKMAELELQSLRTQLNPHFMFNSLNAIQELIVMEENELSQSYLERFARLLRMLLENADQPFISLKKEIDFLKLYLSLESLRIPDLQYSIEADPMLDTEKTMIPNMMLQPYIENALWHGLQNKQGEKKLELNIYRQNELLRYEIKDNGVGRKKAAELKTLYRKEHHSKGMELLSKRFSLLSKEYGEDIQTKVTDVIENSGVAGTLVEITVPSFLTEPGK